MSSPAAQGRAPDGLRLGRYLPLSIGATLAVVALPVVVVAQVGPARGPLAVALHVIAAVALSLALARLLALLWSRHRHSSDLVFADLLLWGWARRAWAERRLEATSRSLATPPEPGEDRAALLERMSVLLEKRDPYTHGHSRRVARHAEQIARGMGLSREQVVRVRAAALVHDIGKINVPRSVLTKPGRLTDAEFELVKRHAADGALMVGELCDPELTSIVRHHHERLDGCGYPDGLAGADIPVGARIIAVADTFDAITSTRPYRTPRTHRQALEIVRSEAGAQLDPDAVEAFTGYYSARGSVGWAAVLLAAPQRLLSGLGGVQSGLAAGAAPLAQTACSTGAAVLIGACFAGSALPAPDRERSTKNEVATVAASDADSPGAPESPREPLARQDPDRRSGPEDEAGGGSATGPTDGGRPRAYEAPQQAPPSGGSQGGGSSGGGSQGGGSGSDPVLPGGLPEPPDVPSTVPDPGTLPDVRGALEPVTDVLPVPAPQVPPLPQVQAPQLQLPQVQLPRLP